MTMTMTIKEISDRLEINNLLIDYCTAIDHKNFDALDDIFTADAFIDYTCFGGPKGLYPEIKAYLKKALPNFSSYQHMLGNMRIHLDGDKARARTICHNPMVVKNKEGIEQTAFFGLWYVDELIKVNDAWRLSKRVEEAAYIHNLPENFAAVPSV